MIRITLYKKYFFIIIQKHTQCLGIILDCWVLLEDVGKAEVFKGTVENSVSAGSEHRPSLELCILRASADEYVIGMFEKGTVECAGSCEPRGYFAVTSPLTDKVPAAEAARALDLPEVIPWSCPETLVLSCTSAFPLFSLSSDSFSRKSIQRSEKDWNPNPLHFSY